MPYESPKPKRGRPKKTDIKPATPVPRSNRERCTRCTRDYPRQRNYFSASQSPLWRVNNGYLPVCRLCVEEMYNNYKDALGDDRLAMRRICMHLDIYWSDEIYDMTCETDNSSSGSRISTYIGKSNLKRFLGKTFDDTLNEESAAAGTSKLSGKPITEDGNMKRREPKAEDVLFWGKGFDADYYDELNRKYKSFTSGMEDLTPAEQTLYRNICLLDVRIAKDYAQGASVKDNLNMLNTLLGSVGAKPSQNKSPIDTTIDNTPLGVWAKRFEDERPIPEVDPELADVDGLGKQVNTWVRGHLAKMMGIKNSYSKLYDEAIDKLRVDHPEYADEDDEDLIYDVFSGGDDDDAV